MLRAIMAGKSPIDDIAKLLSHDAPDRRIAAAIVLGELKARAPEVIKGLVSMLESGAPPLQRPALEALTRIGAPRAVPAMLPLVASRDAEVRQHAVAAIVACGEEVVDLVKTRISSAQPDERKGLDAILARFGDRKDAATTLLGNLDAADPDVARAIALQVRPRIKDADAKTRRMWLGEVIRVLEKMKKTPPPSPISIATAVKILGYLEDDKGTELLLEYARDPKAPFAVRQEALIALRYVIHADRDDKRAADVIDAMVEASEASDRMLAQAAIMGLAAVELPAKHAGRIARLAVHPDPERARIAIEKLARQSGPEVTKALVDVIAQSDRRRGELAAKALETRDDAGPVLASALAAATDADVANTLRFALKPHTKKLPPAARKKLAAAALERLSSGAAWQAHVDVAREAEPKLLAEGLRELAAKLKRSKNKENELRTVLSLLTRTDQASDDDRYQLAAMALRASHLDTRHVARQGDESLPLLESLSDRGFDVAQALRKDKGIELEHLFYVGFHFAEAKHPLGEELLGEVVKQGGRTKLGKMAKNKLGLASSD
jgi:HEAT repeat protein